MNPASLGLRERSPLAIMAEAFDADSVAIIAASSKVDLPFVMAMQTARFLAVLAIGPSLARAIARRIEPRQANS